MVCHSFQLSVLSRQSSEFLKLQLLILNSLKTEG